MKGDRYEKSLPSCGGFKTYRETMRVSIRETEMDKFKKKGGMLFIKGWYRNRREPTEKRRKRMKNLKRFLILCLALLVCCGFCFSFVSSSLAWGHWKIPGPSAQYPSIEPTKEMGMINYLVYLANLQDGDWWGHSTKSYTYGGGGLHALKYSLSYQFRALALVQYHKTPAYRELYQNALSRILQKYFRQDVWGNWYWTSQGAPALDPDWTGYATPWADPVVNKNIMYSGHVLEMVGLYRMLYGDRKYDAEGSITFTWKPAIPTLEVFKYNHESIAKIMYNQFMNNPWHSIECEPNAVFHVCNQTPLLGLLLYDGVNGTNYFPPARDAFLGTFYGVPLFDFATHKGRLPYLVKQNIATTNRDPKPQDEGNLEMFMNVYLPDFVEEQYPYQVAMNPVEEDGTIAANDLDCWFAWLSAEMGDKDTSDRFLNWADKYANPVCEKGMYYYPRDDVNKMGPQENNFLTVARLNIKNGMRIMYNNPWSDAHFAEPYISNVDYPRVLVTQAIYDSGEKRLMVTFVPGSRVCGEEYAHEKRSVWKTSFNVNNLDPAKTYFIEKNGAVIGSLMKGRVKGPGLDWTDDGILTISIPNLKNTVSFIVQEK
jgi:hypothetical protein